MFQDPYVFFVQRLYASGAKPFTNSGSLVNNSVTIIGRTVLAQLDNERRNKHIFSVPKVAGSHSRAARVGYSTIIASPEMDGLANST